MKKVIIFDFDGTICDSFSTFITIINRLSRKFDFKKINEDKVESIREKSTKEVITALGISKLKLPFVVSSARKLMISELHSLLPHSGMVQAIQDLKTKGFQIGCLTSNSEELVILKQQDGLV